MQLLHAHSTTVLAQARPTMFCIGLVLVNICAEISEGDFVNYMYVAVLAVLSATARTGPPVLTNVLTCSARFHTACNSPAP